MSLTPQHNNIENLYDFRILFFLNTCAFCIRILLRSFWAFPIEKLSLERDRQTPTHPKPIFPGSLTRAQAFSNKTGFSLYLCQDPIMMDEKKRISYRNPRKSEGKTRSGGVWGAISIVNIIARIAQKLRRIILLHFGQVVTFRIHFRKKRKVLIFMFFGLG